MENKNSNIKTVKSIKEIRDYLEELQTFIDTYLKKDFSIQQYMVKKSQDEQSLVPESTDFTNPCDSESNQNTVYYF